ncbi:hypothetical protein LJC36_05205 [Desulfovibrio sp. OttesenSCG-928-C14]|nr:hypothetical protein [Desulfovibrio sp. OttesenSCG-928-C14]
MARVNLAHYVEASVEENAVNVEQGLATVLQNIKSLEAHMTSEAGKRDMGELINNYNAANTSFNSFRQKNRTARQMSEDIRGKLAKVLTAAIALNTTAHNTAEEFYKQGLASGQNAQSQLMVISLAGMILTGWLLYPDVSGQQPRPSVQRPTRTLDYCPPHSGTHRQNKRQVYGSSTEKVDT